MLETLSILIDRREAEAIALAKPTPDRTILLDDAQAQRVAEHLDIRRIETIGILHRAKKQARLLHSELTLNSYALVQH